jgi:hypothetical protein
LTPFCANFVSSNGEKLQQTETSETTTDSRKKYCHEFSARRKLWFHLCFLYDGKLQRTETHETRTDRIKRKIVTNSTRGQTVRQTIKAFFSFFFDHNEGDILLSLLTTMPAQSALPPLTLTTVKDKQRIALFFHLPPLGRGHRAITNKTITAAPRVCKTGLPRK